MSKMKIECSTSSDKCYLRHDKVKFNDGETRRSIPFFTAKDCNLEIIGFMLEIKTMAHKNEIDALVHKSMRQVVFHVGHTTSDFHLRSFDNRSSS